MKKIGLIAGSGQFPLIFSKAAVKQGFAVYVAAHLKETDPTIEQEATVVEWVHLGQLKRLIRFFKNHQISEAVMLGAIKKTRMFKDFRPDAKALTLLAGMRHTHDDSILRTFAAALEKEGIVIKPSTILLPDILAQPGCWTRRKPSASEMEDATHGWRLVREIGKLDIGQCIVVGGGSVLAVEAIDGTDATIERGGRLGQGKAVVVKICKPDQDIRFDVPAIGAKTIETMHQAGAKLLVVEAGRAVVFDREEMIGLADRHGISIISVEQL